MSRGVLVSGMTSVYDSEIIWIEKVGEKESEKYLVGDCDLNGAITIKDATTIQLHVAKLITLTQKALLSADVDLSNKINILDATLVQRYIAKLESEGSKCGEYIEISEDVEEPTNSPTIPIYPDDKNYLYYKNTDNWSSVYAYYWHPDNTGFTVWPGVPMEHIKDDVYRIEVPNGVSMIIFNNSSSQTKDIPIEGMHKIYYNDSWHDI